VVIAYPPFVLTWASAQVKASSYSVVNVLYALLALSSNKKSQRLIKRISLIIGSQKGILYEKCNAKRKGERDIERQVVGIFAVYLDVYA
jgi:hypothetical protein